MPQQGTAFQYRVGWFARMFGSAAYSEIVLAEGALRLCRRDGSADTLLPDDLIPSISHSQGLFWDSVGFRHRDGRRIHVGGLRRAEAQTLGQLLEALVAPARQRYFAELERKLQDAEALVARLLDGTRYVRHSDVAGVSQEGGAAIKQLGELGEGPDRSQGLPARYDQLRKAASSLVGQVALANERFIAGELSKHAQLFDTVESKPLTAAQRRACVINDDHNLVLAGAGTGKTSVMIGRVGYLLAAGLAEPDSILMVAYNKDAAQELRDRAAQRLGGTARAEQLTIKTFHALGVELIAEAEGVRPSVSPLVEDSHALARFVTGVLDELLRDPAYAAKFIEYGFDRHESHRSIFEFDSLEEYERELARLRLRRSISLQVTHYHTAVEGVASSTLIATIPRQALKETKGIRAFAMPLNLQTADVRQFWHRRMHHNPAHRWLRGLLFNLLGSA